MGRIVALLTDFGTRDPYVGVMKGVMLGLCPDLVFVDLTHEVAPQEVREGSFHLWASYRFFPSGTVFLAVVDPGVGSGRRAMALFAQDRFFVAPDNGLLTPFLKDPFEAREIPVPPEASPTFHGRDVFAPAAAQIACRGALPKEWPAITDPVRSPWPEPHRKGDQIEGEVLHVDRFGNLITNIPGDWLKPGVIVEVQGVRIRGLKRTYAEVPPGAFLALVGSSGLLEISVREGSAAQRLKAGQGAKVRIGLP